MKHAIKRMLARRGLHLYTDGSLPTGVNWLHDIRRSGLIDAAPVCLDVGANIGQTVGDLRDACPSATIHAFEPFASTYAELQAAWGGRPGVTLVRQAMGAAKGSVRAAAAEQSVLSSLRQPAVDAANPASEEITVGTVDDYARDHRLARIDILKTDTEGYDLEVLRGAMHTLRAQDIVFVYSEVTLYSGNAHNTPFEPVFELLSDCRYRFLGLYETYPLHRFAAPNLFCNALFVASAHWKAVTR